ncbi:putative ABC transport system permease protein [Anaerospora hongkongensis]|uniref:Putative ABC transport system permease protein n=2 Tax=Anaerospora hongkongensis TaxID=244830 RepID=A0A4V2Q8I9_9FIRM|nr:putative ABC transport system permease protein [Anaerospora hongkongensis]
MFVALLAVAIGATVLSGLVTIYYDVPRQMGREFRSYGANLVLIPTGGSQTLQEKDVVSATALLTQEKLVGMAPYLYDRAKVNEQPVMVAGTRFEEVKKVSPYWQVRGQWPAPNTTDVVIGADVAELLKVEPGQMITLSAANSSSESKVKVAGIVRTGGTEENFLFMDLPELQKMLQKDGQISVAQASIMATEAELNSLIGNVETQVSGVTPRLVKRVTQSEAMVLGKLQALVYLVTIVVLLLTLICVATTMMAVVAERRKEIGLKKALGAENRSIALEFLGEGLTLGALGGMLGTVLGFFFAETVSVNVFGRAISFQPFIAVSALVVAIVVAGVACLIPVRVATAVEPAIVLRGE